jgi:hypothetical protein
VASADAADCSSGTTRGTASSPSRPAGPETEIAPAAEHGHRHAADAGLLLPVVEGVTLLGDERQLGQQLVGVGHRAVGARRHAALHEQPARRLRRHLGQQDLPHAGAVQVHPAADLGEHPHRVPGGHLGGVDDAVAVEHRHVGGLTDGVDQPGEVRLGPRGQHA